MPDDLPGPSLGELRAASANMMAWGLAATFYPSAFKAEADRQDYLLRAQTVGVDQDAAERILAGIVEGRSHRNLPLTPELVYRLALEKVYGFDGYVSPEQRFVDSLPDDRRRALVACAEEAAMNGGITRQAALWALVHVMAGYDSGVNGDA